MAFDKDGKTVLPANIYYDRKKEIYYADKVYKGERIYFAGKTKAEAEKRLRKRLYEIDMHISPQKKSNVTVEELFELYVGEYHPELKPTTVQQYRFLYDYYLKDFIGKVKLKNLLPYHIQKVYNHLVEKKMKQGTVNNVRKMLRTLLNEAVRRGMLSADDNPYPKVKAPSNLPVKQQRSFTEEQRDQFLQYAGKSLYANLYKLLLYTGMRVGEALALMICDVNWDNHVLHVTKNLQKTTQGVFYIETPKTRESIRDIYLVPEAEEAIKSQLELRKIIVEPIQEDIKGEFENLLFVNTKGKPVNVGSVRQSINRIVEKIRADGNNCPDIWIHAMRHGYVSIAVARGVPLEVVQANVGHTSIETTMRYLELQPDYIRKQSMKISDIYQSKEAGDKSMQ